MSLVNSAIQNFFLPYLYIEVRDGIKFTLTLSSSNHQSDDESTNNSDLPSRLSTSNESSDSMNDQANESVHNMGSADDEQNILFNLHADARDVAKLLETLGLAAGEVRAPFKMCILL